jgi:nitrogen fixation protein NifX
MAPIKIAIASSDGKNINMHLGSSSHFLIFQKDGNKVKFIELREKVKKPLKEHSDKWMQALEILSDVKIVICSKVGPEPRQELEKRGIKTIESEESINDALQRYLADN